MQTAHFSHSPPPPICLVCQLPYVRHAESITLPMAVVLLITTYMAFFFFHLNRQPLASWWYQPYENVGITLIEAKVP